MELIKAWGGLSFIFTIALFWSPLAAAQSGSTITTCEAPAATEGAASHVTCHFPTDLSKMPHPVSFTLERYSVPSGEQEIVFECLLKKDTTVDCDKETEGYTFDKIFKKDMVIYITAASAENNGKYACKSMYKDSPKQDPIPCNFIVSGKDEEQDNTAIIVGVTIGVIVVIVLVMAFVILRKRRAAENERKRTPDPGNRTPDPGNRTPDPGNRTSDEGARGAITDEGNRTTDGGNRTTDEGNRTTDQGNRTTDQGNRTSDEGNRTTDGGNRTTDPENRTSDEGNRTTDGGNRTTDPENRTPDEGNRTSDEGNSTSDEGARGSAAQPPGAKVDKETLEDVTGPGLSVDPAPDSGEVTEELEDEGSNQSTGPADDSGVPLLAATDKD